MSDGFPKAGGLLTEAADHIAEAARIIVAEAARAQHLTREISQVSQSWQSMAGPPVSSLATQELTEMATTLAKHRNEVAMYGAWLSKESA